jgi:hypothetical protein
MQQLGRGELFENDRQAPIAMRSEKADRPFTSTNGAWKIDFFLEIGR